MLGVTAAHGSRSAILTAGVAGLAAGAMAMAAGEYVSVASQRDAERADLARERRELAATPLEELDELASLYAARGVDPALARQVAEQLTARDVLAAHARDELGLTDEGIARPGQAAIVSAGAFAAGAFIAVASLLVAPSSARAVVIVLVTLASLAGLGRLGAAAGGAPWRRPTVRVMVGGALAMSVTAGVGLLVHTAGA